MEKPDIKDIDISVIMPTWRSATFVMRAIESVLAQTGVSFELVIVDDASPDDTFDIITQAARGDPRIIVNRLAENAGPSGARNRAIALARGAFLAVLDDDDVMAPTRLATLLAAAKAHKADIVVDNMRPVYHPQTEPGDKRFLDMIPDAAPRQILLKEYIDPQTEEVLGEGLGYLKPLFRASALERLDLSYDMSLRNSEDFYLVAEMLASGCKMVLIPEADYHYTIREGSLSHRLKTDHAKAIVDAERRFRARFAGQFDPPTADASKRQLKQRLNYYAFAQLVDALKARRPIKSIGVMLRHAGSVPYMVKTLTTIALKKLT